MYYYGGYSGYGNTNPCCYQSYPTYGYGYGGGYGGGGYGGGYSYGAALILVLFILLVVVFGAGFLNYNN